MNYDRINLWGKPEEPIAQPMTLFNALPLEIQLRIINWILRGRYALNTLTSLMEVYPYLKSRTVIMYDLEFINLQKIGKLHPIFSMEGLRYVNITVPGGLEHCSHHFPIKIPVFYNHDLKIPESLESNLPIYTNAINIASLLVIRNRGTCSMASKFLNKNIARNPTMPVKYFWDLTTEDPLTQDLPAKSYGTESYSARVPSEKKVQGITVNLRGRRIENYGPDLDLSNAKQINWRVPDGCWHVRSPYPYGWQDEDPVRVCKTPRLSAVTTFEHTNRVFISYNGGKVPMLSFLGSSPNPEFACADRKFTLYNHQWDPKQPCGEISPCSLEPEEDEAHTAVVAHQLSDQPRTMSWTGYFSSLDYFGVPDQVLSLTVWSSIRVFKWKRLCPTPGSIELRRSRIIIKAPSLKALHIASVMLKAGTNPLPLFQAPQLETLVLQALPGSDAECNLSRVFTDSAAIFDAPGSLRALDLIGVERAPGGEIFSTLHISDFSLICKSLVQLVISQYQIDLQTYQHFSGAVGFPKLAQLTIDLAGVAQSGYYEGKSLKTIVIDRRVFPYLETLLLDSSDSPLVIKGLVIKVVCAQPESLAVRLTDNSRNAHVITADADI